MSTIDLMTDLVSPENSVMLGEVATLRDGFNTGSAGQRAQLLSETRHPQSSAQHLSSRLCLEGKWITPYQIKVRSLWIRLPKSTSKTRQLLYNNPKIIYRQTATHPIAAVDLHGLCYLNSAHAIVIDTDTHDPLSTENLMILHAICAYLNSQRCQRYYQALSGEKRVTFPQVHVSTMRKLRVPKRLLDFKDPLTQSLAQYAQQLSEGLFKSDSRQELLAQIERIICQLVKSPSH